MTADGSSEFAAAAGRYHLYVSYACPWAHRTLITRALRGLENAVSVTAMDPLMGPEGWAFTKEDPDPIFGAALLRDVYLRADAKYTGKVTVPVLWDKKTSTLVNNESRDVMRMLDTQFDAFAESTASLAPPALIPEIDAVLDAIYDPINNGVYRAGFATQQHAYEAAVRALFTALDHWDAVLQKQRFLTGETLTEADVAIFTTLLRFDLVYYAHFKCNVRRVADYAGLWRFVREMWAMPAVRGVCNLDHIKRHYYWSQDSVNPTRIVPVGPTLALD